MQNRTLYFITGNKHKYSEISRYFKDANLDFEVIQKDLDMIEPQWDTLEQVAEYKLKSVMKKLEGNVFIEDAGFFVDALRGFPGVYSSYVNKSIGNPGILKLMVDQTNRSSKFCSVIALYLAELDEIHYFLGEVHGTVASRIRGEQGFGFDPIFIPNEMPDKTFAEISTHEKNTISHRSRAIQKLIHFMKNY